MRTIIYIFAMFFCFISSAFALIENTNKKVAATVTSEHVMNWSLALFIVLSLFFACIWIMRKMGAFPATNYSNMRVVGGVSLGVREKLVLVQVGEKQMILGVTPGRISNLLVLEGEEQLFKDKEPGQGNNNFSQKLKQLLAGSANE